VRLAVGASSTNSLKLNGPREWSVPRDSSISYQRVAVVVVTGGFCVVVQSDRVVGVSSFDLVRWN